ncbi:MULTISPECIES: hypothetical protein [unclassified Arcicella]|uniref:hypothetical protein n=1 Tax=unclassified Arcicella TaxID=2644986 RepID=UPI002861C4FE|nr:MULTISPECIES: hypothetical protein [unclassified Arcicella]MDR6561379.1 hypothetical protein [Arcicella sp. BE51]MDR6811263.1 hypothetical protein [Arcicella sp. BE140]MDR6822613.1 hypothetical protein [Arcicella sp. BE139]
MNAIREKETVVSYFSNLSKCLDQVITSLVINGWESKINYTAVYRSLKEKGKYTTEFRIANNKVFKIVITPRTINPSLTMLGIEEKP